jgi:hypothetical protein
VLASSSESGCTGGLPVTPEVDLEPEVDPEPEMDRNSSLIFCLPVEDVLTEFWEQGYKTFYGRILQIFVIS